MTLYKYLHPDRTDLLQNRKIRYSQIYALNDPFEGKPYYENLAPDEVLTSILTKSFNQLPLNPLESFADELISGLRGKLGDMPSDIVDDIESAFHEILPTPENPNRTKEAFGDFVSGELIPLARTMGSEIRRGNVRTFNTQLGILCLSEVCDSNLMWAHYAANSRGFVVGFDDSNPYFKDSPPKESMVNRLYEVDYSATRPAADHMIELAFRDILLTKPLEWHYEREQRHIRYLSDGEPLGNVDELGEPIYLFGFPADIVAEIVFGSRMSAENKAILIAGLNADDFQHVKIFQASESDTKYELLFAQIR
jgi:hypothetical protein